MPDTTRLTDAELDAMEQRVNAATPGPFVESRYAHGGGRQWSSDCEPQILVCECFDEANRDFHFHARTDVPRLIVALRAERVEVGWLQRSILAFGNNPAGFDWGVLEKLDDLESENARLRERLAALEGKEPT